MSKKVDSNRAVFEELKKYIAQETGKLGRAHYENKPVFKLEELKKYIIKETPYTYKDKDNNDYDGGPDRSMLAAEFSIYTASDAPPIIGYTRFNLDDAPVSSNDSSYVAYAPNNKDKFEDIQLVGGHAIDFNAE